MRKLKEQGYQDMLPPILDLECQDYGALSHHSAGNRPGVSKKFDETEDLVKHAETKWCKEVHNQSTIDPALPELVAFLQEISASDVDSGGKVTRHALWTETSTSYVVKFKAKQVLHKDQVDLRSPEQVEMEKKVDVHVKDEIPVIHISPDMPPIHGHIPGETSATPISAASYIAAAIEHDVPCNINQRQGCPGISEFANAFEVESKLMLGIVMSETGTKSGQILIKKRVCGDAYFPTASPIASPPTESDTVPNFSAISLHSKSNRSTTRSMSFSFPLLPFEWNGSPIKMAKADRTKLQEQQNRSWWTCFVCCKQKYISQRDSDDDIAHKIAKQ